jgi:hypothetical protein
MYITCLPKPFAVIAWSAPAGLGIAIIILLLLLRSRFIFVKYYTFLQYSNTLKCSQAIQPSPPRSYIKFTFIFLSRLVSKLFSSCFSWNEAYNIIQHTWLRLWCRVRSLSWLMVDRMGCMPSPVGILVGEEERERWEEGGGREIIDLLTKEAVEKGGRDWMI